MSVAITALLLSIRALLGGDPSPAQLDQAVANAQGHGYVVVTDMLEAY